MWLVHGSKFHPQSVNVTMMPPSNHAMKQPAQRAMVSIPPMNQMPTGSNVAGPTCNGQNVSSPHASSFAAALRKLAKKAIDPAIEQEKIAISEPSPVIIHGNHATDINASPGALSALSLTNSSQYKRPPPPPLIQSRQPSNRCSSENSPPVVSISPNPNSLVHNNSCQGIDYSINRETSLHAESNLKKSFYNRSGEQSSPNSFHSMKDFSSIPSNVPQIRSTCSSSSVSLSSSSSHHPADSLHSTSNSVGFHHPYSHQNTISNQSKATTLTAKQPINSSPYPQIHPTFFSSSVPTSVYRYNTEPMYLEPYSSLLRPSLHAGLVLPPTSPHFPSSVNHASSTYPGSSFTSHYNTSAEFMLSPKTTNSSSMSHNLEMARIEEERRKRECSDNEVRSSSEETYPNLISRPAPAIHHSTIEEPKQVAAEFLGSHDRRYYDDISPPADQNMPLSLTKVASENESNSASHYPGSAVLPIKSINQTSLRPPSSQLPKERYKHMQVQKALQSQELKPKEHIKDIPSDLSIRRIQAPTICTESHFENVESTQRSLHDPLEKTSPIKQTPQDYNWESVSDLSSNSSIRTSHYLPVRHVELQRSVTEPAGQSQKSAVNGSAIYENAFGNERITAKPYIKCEVNEISVINNKIRDGIRPDAGATDPTKFHEVKSRIFNPAFHEKVITTTSILTKDSSTVISTTQSMDNAFPKLIIKDKNIPVIVSKLDRELKRLQEYRQYNRFAGSDQSDDDLTDIDEDEFERHEEIRRYHLMTITSGPPMKLTKNPEKSKFLQLFGLTTHRCHSSLETNKYKRQQRIIKRDVFPKVDTLVMNKIFEKLFTLTESKQSHSSKSSDTSTHQQKSHTASRLQQSYSNSPSKLKFFRKLGLNNAKNETADIKRNSSDSSSEQLKETTLRRVWDHCSPESEDSNNFSVAPAEAVSEKKELTLRKRSYDDVNCDSVDGESNSDGSTSPKVIVLNSSKNVSDVECSSVSFDAKNNNDVLTSDLCDPAPEKSLSHNFAQEFHNSVLQKTQEQQALKMAAAASSSALAAAASSSTTSGSTISSISSRTSRTIGRVELDEGRSCSLSHHSHLSVPTSNINSYSSSTSTTAALATTPTTPTTEPFKWQGIQAVMEAYERHYDLQKLEKDILSSQCHCLKIKNKELANLAEKLRSRMCDLITSKKQLDNERQQRQYAIDNLKRCIKDIR